MLANLLTKTCEVFDILPKENNGSISPVDTLGDGIIIKCNISLNSINYTTDYEQIQQANLILITQDHAFLRIKQVVKFNDEFYKILNIKPYISYPNHTINQGLRLELIKYDNY